MPHQRNRYLNGCLHCPVIGEQELGEEGFTSYAPFGSTSPSRNSSARDISSTDSPVRILNVGSTGRIDKEHISHLPQNLGPGIMRTLPSGSGMPLIDGNHRAARSLFNRTQFQVFILDETETLELLRRSMGTAAADHWWQRLLASKPPKRLNREKTTMPTRVVDADALVVARNNIFLAMFKRAADQLELDVYSDRDDDYSDVHIDELSVDLAGQLFDLLVPLNLLDYIAADAETAEDLAALSRYTAKVAIGLA